MLRCGFSSLARRASARPMPLQLSTGARAMSTGAVSGTMAKTQFREPDPSKPKLVLAYSGGLDTSTQLAFLAQERGFEVIAYIADLAQDDVLDDGAIEEICEKARMSGAYAFYCEDLRAEFLTDYVFKCIQANALYEGRYLLGTAMARPCIAKRQVEIAHAEGATHISHGSTGKGNDQVRFEVRGAALPPLSSAAVRRQPCSAVVCVPAHCGCCFCACVRSATSAWTRPSSA